MSFQVVKLLGAPIQINTNLNPTGVYDAATTYGIGDSVSLGNSSYIAIQATTGNTPPNATYWQLLATAATNKLTTTALNLTGITIPAGAVVYFSGVSGNVPTLALSQANTESASTRTIGITAVSIANNANGEIVIFGLADNLNTSALTAGSPLWLSPTVAGGLTMIKPTAPNHNVFIGFCTRSHPTDGTIEVKIQNGYALNELHDVAINTILDNQVIKYDSVTSLWKNETLTSSDVGLGNVPNVDATNPANIVQTSSYRFVTDAEKATYNSKQDALGFTPENTANKTTNFAGNTGSNTLFATVKATFDAVVGYLANYQPLLGFTPANDALSNLSSTAANNSINPDTNITHTLGASGLNWASVATKELRYDDYPNFDVELRSFVDSNTKASLDYENRTLKDSGSEVVLDWKNHLIDKEKFGLIGNSFETVSKNLKQYDYSLNYSSGTLTSIVYTVPSLGTITKTLNYQSGLLTSVVLSGSTPNSISLTKTLTYSSGVLVSIAYT